jgi:aminopeptidase N
MRYFMLPMMLIFFLSGKAQEDETVELEYLKETSVSEQQKALGRKAYKANPHTVNYDVGYHRLQWEVDPAVDYINGQVTTYFTALADLDKVIFDLTDHMKVSSVTQRGEALDFEQNQQEELVISLAATQKQNVLDSLVIIYEGNPVSSGFGSFEVSTHGPENTPVLWTLSEPYGAKGWWPCKQDLTDKIDSVDILIKHPNQYKAASNGLLVKEVSIDGKTLTHWRHKYPIPAYLIAMAVTNYSVYDENNTGLGFSITNYVYPEDLNFAKSRTAITPDIMKIYEQLFEPYPYANEKYGHAQFGWGGGMEHTTMTFMGGYSRGLIAHELAHQWFGNKVTCGSWQDIWLNEGFATYLDGLVYENIDGEELFKQWRKSLVEQIIISNSGSVFVSDTTSVSRIFDSRLSYKKGAMLLHMLRYKLGDEAFFDGIKNYLADPELSYGYARTTDLQKHLEASGGEDLEEFFNDWFYGQGYPEYEVVWNQDGSGTVHFQVNQRQSHPSVSFFDMPLPITVTSSSGESEKLRLEVSEDKQVFSVSLNFQVAGVSIDPDTHLISKNNSVVLGLDQESLENILSVYPNPAVDELHITSRGILDIRKVSIYDIQGKKILDQYNPGSSIGLENLHFGLHLVVIDTDQGTLNKTILKK